MRVGFTGTRNGMTGVQASSLEGILRVNVLLTGKRIEAHHGRCVGVDCEVHEIIRGEFDDAWIVVHPPVKTEHEGVAIGDEERPRKSHFASNRDIVDETDGLIVIPWQFEWQPRGGTWYTHDYAIKRGKPVLVIWPNGVVKGSFAS